MQPKDDKRNKQVTETELQKIKQSEGLCEKKQEAYRWYRDIEIIYQEKISSEYSCPSCFHNLHSLLAGLR